MSAVPTPDDIERSSGTAISRRGTDGEELTARVRVSLADVASLDAMPARQNPPRHGLRTAGVKPSAADDPCNAIVLYCDVPGSSAGPLSGWRIGVKDNLAVAGIPTAGAELLDDPPVPAEDALVVERLLEAGAQITAKTAIGHFGPSAGTRNPHDQRFSPGFSSSGSGAAVAGGLVDAALGTDLAGSVRIPSAWCGLVGMKPTNGLVPSAPGLPVHLLDVIGPIATGVAESATMLRAIAGDDWDAAGWHVALEGASGDLHGLRVGVIAEAADPAVCTPGILRAFSGARARLAALGVEIVSLSVPLWPVGPELLHAMLTLWSVASAGHWLGTDCDYTGRIDEARPAPKMPSAARAQTALVAEELRRQGDPIVRLARARNLQLDLRRQIDEALDAADVLVTPCTVQGPFALDDPRLADPVAEHALLKRLIRNTAPLNLAGHPALSVPAGHADDDLPAGLQIIGRRFDERSIYRAALAFEASA